MEFGHGRWPVHVLSSMSSHLPKVWCIQITQDQFLHHTLTLYNVHRLLLMSTCVLSFCRWLLKMTSLIHFMNAFLRC
uniref:Uncharacterized protein n=1 Tax=Anguilla anguilla TaxID=7936 RepID=A0A0E9TL45_ANGAN